ncbi:MAG: RnfABCDGE type electron transport complex subunit B [Clostridia bacterium]|nr:RnfABCDGE type electron transport complex subunit B [Clostridia bacterium]
MNWTDIIWAVVWFAVIGGALGLMLAFAGKVFAVKRDEKAVKIQELLPGANCGGCGYAGCAALAEAIAKGEAKPDACNAASRENTTEIGKIMGIDTSGAKKMRAQVMCSGTHDLALKKYVYDGDGDCIAAARLGGGDKLCPFGCIGLGTCAAVCKFDAIVVKNGVAAVDYEKCVGCGACVNACPKHIIRLVPFDCRHWVGCMSQDKGPLVRKYCDVGCIGCHLCEKNCESGAIKVNGFLAEIDYEKCTGCDKCVTVCPRHIIWSSKTQGDGLMISREALMSELSDDGID